MYIGREKVYGGKVVEYYFRSQEDFQRALRDQVSNIDERFVYLSNNRLKTRQTRLALPIGIEKPKVVEIKGIIRDTGYGKIPVVEVGV